MLSPHASGFPRRAAAESPICHLAFPVGTAVGRSVGALQERLIDRVAKVSQRLHLATLRELAMMPQATQLAEETGDRSR
jgi:hypothetical protein